MLVPSVDFPEIVGDGNAGPDCFAGDDLTNLPPGNQEDGVAVVLQLSLCWHREVAGGYEDSDPPSVELGGESRQFRNAACAQLALCLSDHNDSQRDSASPKIQSANEVDASIA